MIKKTAILVLISLLGIQTVFSQTEALNLAKYQATTASASGSSIPAQFATDGFVSMDNRWGVFTSGPHWLEVTLATPMTIGSSHLYLGTPSGYLISNFVLQYHDGASWIDIPGATVSGNSLPVRNVEFTTPITAQKFRLYTTDSNPQVKEIALYAPTSGGSPVPFGSDLDLNVAKMRQYAYSSVSGSNYPKLAFDGYVDDSSAWASTNTAGPHDLEIHLAQNEVINGIHLYSGSTGVAGSQIEDFEVAYHDGSNWVLFDGGSVSGNTELNRVVMFNTAVSTAKVRIRSLDNSQAFIREFVVLPDDGGTGYPLWTDAKNEAPPALSFLDYEDSYFTIENRSAGLNLSSSTTGSFTTSEDPWFQVLLNLGTDTYRLRSKESEACFEVALASTADGAAVVEGTYSSMPHQRWQLEDVDGTHVRIVNAWSGMVLGLDGTNVVQQIATGGQDQQWKINYETHYPKQGQASAFHFSSMFKSSWGYNWGYGGEGDLDSGQYMPMQWGGMGATSPGILNNQPTWYGRANQTTVMGFNEPDNTGQANMTEETAAYQWPRLERMRMPLLGPGVDHYFGSWRVAYEAIAEEQGLRSDYMAMHRYSTEGASTGSPSQLINRMQGLYDEYGKPIWLTEFSTRDFVGDKTTWSRNHNYNFLAEFAWRAETLPWLKKWSVFEWGIYGGDPDTTDASSDDPAEMNSPRLSLHYNNDASDPGWEDLAECGLFLAGWDGNTNTVDETAYIIHNKGRFLRLMDHPDSAGPTTADVLHRAATEQFQFETAPNGNKYIVGLSDGRRLSCNGSSIGLATAGTTGTSVEWEFNEYQYGWVYIDHPSTGKRLRITDANEIDVTNDSDTYDNVRFRFIKHYNPISLTEVQTLPYAESFEDGVGAWREFDNASARFWEVGSGGTPTAGAGPSGASDGEYYLFSEGHDAGSYVTNTVECIFDFSSVADVELIFDYHMYGTYIDFLSLDVFDGTTWTSDVWKKTGQQHAGSDVAWSTAVLDLSSYAGNSEVTLRFRTANKLWNASDPAIDNIRIANSAFNYAPVADAQSVTATSGEELAITLSGSDVDGDGLSFSFSQPTNGTLTGVAPNLTYQSNNGFDGSDAFTFTVNDGVLDSAPATVSITVDPFVDPGQVIFNAATDNTTIVANSGHGGPGVITGVPGALVYTAPADSFNNSGFSSTENINSLLGKDLTDEDTVTIRLTTTSITGGTLRSQGIHFGMAGAAVEGGISASNMLARMSTANSGNDFTIATTSFQDGGTDAGDTTVAEQANGFDLTLVANVDGYTFTMVSVGNTSPLTYSGTFSGTEFVDYFGTGHFYYTAQNQFDTALTTAITEASISVVLGAGEQGEAPELIAGGTSVSDGNLNISFTGSVGFGYNVESKEDLTDTDAWTVVTNISPLPESPMSVALPATNSAAFYRIVVE